MTYKIIREHIKGLVGSASWTSTWSTAFADIVHSICLIHNEAIHNTQASIPHDPVKHIHLRISGANSSDLFADETRSIVSVKWDVPDLGWIKINVDAAVRLQNMHTGIGGLARDNSGNWIRGFTGCIGQASLDY